jgi:hypothetical protein
MVTISKLYLETTSRQSNKNIDTDIEKVFLYRKNKFEKMFSNIFMNAVLSSSCYKLSLNDSADITLENSLVNVCSSPNIIKGKTKEI